MTSDGWWWLGPQSKAELSQSLQPFPSRRTGAAAPNEKAASGLGKHAVSSKV